MKFEDQLKAEAESWTNPDTDVGDKLLRERIRHYGLIRSLLLDKLPTYRFDVLEVGGGPLPISDLLPYSSRTVIDPCTEAYRAIAPCPDHYAGRIEDFRPEYADTFDLIIATNSLDHVESPHRALASMSLALRHGGYMAILCCENNALNHPHPAHKVNLTVTDIHSELDADYETVYQLTFERDGFRYGWRRYDGVCGQPAFAWLGRKAY